MIKINQITKRYSVKNVLDNVSISIQPNSNYCLLGKNGAGKTTLINILADFIEPNSGKVLFDNLSYAESALEIKKNIGVMCEANYLIEELSGYEYLTFVGKLYGIPKKELEKRINSLTIYFFSDVVDIERSISVYSRGMKQKLMFCASVLHKPKILLLDEPFAGLDPIAANLLIEFLNNYRNKNRIIFLSSHSLNYIEKVATHIGVLDKGKILFNGTLDSFLDNGKNNIDDSLLRKLNPTPAKIREVEWAF
jgi:ABC-2 type transport system ATP-binding protein